MQWILIGAIFLVGCAGALSHGDAPAGYEQGAPLLEGLGDHHHAVTTRVHLAQRYFDQGLVLAFGFNHAEAARSFREARTLDPDCAMCWWGEALVLGPNINDTFVSDEDALHAWRALQWARSRAPLATPRERDYIAALAARYQAEPVADRAALDRAYADAMGALAAKYPDDADAQTLWVEAVMDTMPWDYWLPGPELKPEAAEALAALERVLDEDPEHPLANHLYIHLVEYGAPGRGVAAADRLGGVAPGAGHLVHMPAHIYIRVGRYADATDANERAIESDDEYVTQCHAQGLYPLAYMPHNHHFLWYAATMEGRSQRAIDAARRVRELTDQSLMREPGYGTLQHFYSLPLYALVRFGRWEELLAEPRTPAGLRYPQGVWHYGRGMALANTGRLWDAEEELAILSRLADDPSLDSVTIWETNSTRHLLQIARADLRGEIALRRGEPDAAIAAFEEAVALEDALTYDEPPPWHTPERQRLAAALLAAGRPAEAEAAYRADLAKYPANGWSLRGLEQALRAQGQDAQADAVRERLRESWQRADVPS